jgi:hypothetical protein
MKEFPTVERFFRPIVHPAVEKIRYRQLEMGTAPTEHGFVNVEILERFDGEARDAIQAPPGVVRSKDGRACRRIVRSFCARRGTARKVIYWEGQRAVTGSAAFDLNQELLWWQVRCVQGRRSVGCASQRSKSGIPVK